MPDFIPRPDAELLSFSRVMAERVSADPAAWGVPVPLAEELSERQAAYATAFLVASAPDTRTGSAVLAKDERRAELVRTIRQVAAIVRAWPGVSPEMRHDLGLTAETQRRRRVPVPVESPELRVKASNGHRVTIELSQQETLRKARPRDVATAGVFTFVGDEPPGSPSEWIYRGTTTKTRIDLYFDASIAPGTKVWICAQWQNARGEAGPVCTPKCAYIQFGGEMDIAGGLRVAA